MIRQLLVWLDHRTGYKELLNEALYERVPGGARWRYVWGSTLVFTFVLQMITGICLWMAYSPSVQTAWASVYYIQEEMFLGNVIRGMHHFAAQAMTVLLAIHLMQVVIDGAYKAPREVNFWLGLVLMQIILALGLTGYLLPWDQKGYYATKVTTNIMGATPIVGEQVQILVQGGKEYGHHTLTRFFAMHTGILPASLIAFLGLHIYVFRRHGITVHNPDHKPDTTFWPDQVLKDAVACLGVLAIVMGLAIFKGAELSAPADASEAYSAARPEWYFLFLFRFLRFHIVESFGLAFGALYVPGLLMGIIAMMPIIAWKKGGHRFNVVFMCCLAACVIGLTGMAIYEDYNDEGHQSALAAAEHDALRAKELARRPSKILPRGAGALLRNDPLSQGPRLFARHCSSCHRYDGHNGRGEIVADAATATDLGKFGSREWMRAVLIDFENHLQPVRDSLAFKAAKKKIDDGADDISLIDFESGMSDWTGGSKDSLLSAENKENLDGLVEFLVQQAGHDNVSINVELAGKGRAIAIDGNWSGDLNGTTCDGCHPATLGNKFVKLGDEEVSDGYPDLAEYGSAAWLTDFIRNPGSAQHYGTKNLMAAYDDTKLRDDELQLLVRWLTGDYFVDELEE